MFDRAGQVNARFAGESFQGEAITQALLALGLQERQITSVKRADPGDWQQPEGPGLLLRLLCRFGGTREAVAAPTPDALMMVYLSSESGLAERVQAVLHDFGATRVDYYPAGQIATSSLDKNGAGQGVDTAHFSAAFPDSEQRHRASRAAAPDATDAKL
jgi:hypothetical protein